MYEMADALGFPDATDTGVQPGVTLTPYNGNLIINTPGVTIENLDIHGYVIINADNVTLKNCKVTTNDFWGISVGGGGWSTGGVGCVIQNCEVNGLGTGDGASGIVGGGSFIANNIYGWENGIVPDHSNTLIQDNYIHDLKGAGNPHYDGIDIEGGGYSNIIIRHNTVINQNTQTSAFYMSNDFGSVSNVIIDNNKLIGGGYTVYSDQKSSLPGKITGVQFTNNVMTSGYYGYADINNNTVVWQGNTDLASGRLVSQDGILSSVPSQIAITAFSTDSGVPGDHITNDSTLTLTGTAAANSTVKVFDGANQIGTATANSSGAWTYTTTALSDGSHSLTAQNSSGTSSTPLSVTIDTTAPSTPGIVSNTINAGKVTLNGTAEANSTVQVFDGSTSLGSVTTSSSGTWTFTTVALTTGSSHSFTAKATDAAGNISGASATTNVTIGSSTPTAPGVPTVASFSNDSGVVGDHITNDNTLTLTGTAQANSTVKVYDGATLLGSVVANASGAWSYTTSALGDGQHNLSATASDAAGNTSAASAALSVTIDTKAPTAPVIGSNSVSPTNVVTLNGTAEANSTVTVFDGTTKLATVTANASGAWSYSTAALPAGNHSFTATDTDAAGNTGAASSSLNLSLATPVPVSLLAGTAAWSNLAFPTQTASFTATFDTTPSQSGADIVIGLGASNAAAYTDLAAIVRFNDTNTIDVRSGSNYGADVSVPYSPGTNYHFRMVVNPSAHTYSVYVTPQGGTEIALATNYTFRTEQATDSSLADVGAFSTAGSAAVTNFSVVGALPGAPTISSFSTDSGTVGDHITSDNTLTLTGTAQANSTVKVYDGATLLGSAVASGSGAWSYTTLALADGPHNLTATASNASGQTSVASSALAVSIDTKAPVAPSITSFSPDTGTVGDGMTTANVITLTGTAEANSTVKIYDGTSLLNSVVANSSGAWSFTTGALANGGHNISATATDAAGNTSAASTALAVTVMAALGAPTITSFTPDTGVVGDGITDPAILTLTGNAAANSTVNVYDGTTLLGTATTNAGGTWNFTTVPLPDGMHSFTATDTMAGVTSAASAVMKVLVDTVAPVAPTLASFSTDSGVVGDHITNDSTLTLTGNAEANSTVKVYDSGNLLGSVVANSSGAWSFTTPALSDGTHSLTAKASDAAANTSVASSALSVTIDTTAPVAPTIASFSNDSGTVGDHATTDKSLTLTGTAEANSTVHLYDGNTLLGSATANGTGGWSYSTGNLAIGTHNFTATDSDIAGNTSVVSSVFDVSIEKPHTALSVDVQGFTSLVPGFGFLTGTTAANSLVSISDGVSGASLGMTAANTAGSWILPVLGQTNSVRDFIVKATDLTGNTGVDHVVYGTTHNDTITNSAPNEFLYGNGGNDTFVFSGNIGKDTIGDFSATNDVLQFSRNVFTDFASALAHASQVGPDVTIAVDSANSVTLHNTALSQLTHNNIHIV
jgi:large repetitive protein